jgi:hypothetical protein
VYNVKLTYFKDSGKYYSGGTYPSEQKDLWEIFTEVRRMVETGELPGLCKGAKFTTLIDVPDHPHNYPHLVMQKER